MLFKKKEDLESEQRKNVRLFQPVTCQRFPEYLVKPKLWGWPWILSRNGAFAFGSILLITLVILTVQNNNRHHKKLRPKQINNIGSVFKGNLSMQFPGGTPTSQMKIQEKESSECSSECTFNRGDLKLICKNIQNNPGQVAAQCIDSLNISTISLIFTNCIFSQITPGWLPLKTKTILKSLNFNQGPPNLDFLIDPLAFSNECFQEMDELNFVHTNFKFLQNGSFDGLEKLKSLKFEEISSKGYDFGVFRPLKNLENLQFYRFTLEPEEMKNLTGAGNLNSVIMFDGRDMNLREIPKGAFAFPKAQQIFLQRSKIECIAEGAWNSDSLQQLLLDDNLLTTLTKDLIKYRQDLSITLGNNRWDCTCDIYWIKELKNFLEDQDTTTCFTPENLKNIPILEANFCNDIPTTNINDETTVTTTTTNINDETTVTPSGPDYTEINVTCKEVNSNLKSFKSRHLFSYLIVKGDFQKISVSEDENSNNVYIELINPNFGGVTLLVITDDQVNSCFTNIQSSVSLQLSSNTNYMFCLVEKDNQKSQISPLDCHSYTTKAIYNERLWLKNSDKDFVIGLSVGLFIIIIALTAGFVFFIIRKNPNLISGSSRVIKVKSRKEVLLTEKGVELPPSPRMSETSSINGVSSASYISVPDEEAHVHFWRFNLWMERNKRNYEQENKKNMRDLIFAPDNSIPANYVDLNLDTNSYASIAE